MSRSRVLEPRQAARPPGYSWTLVEELPETRPILAYTLAEGLTPLWVGAEVLRVRLALPPSVFGSMCSPSFWVAVVLFLPRGIEHEQVAS